MWGNDDDDDDDSNRGNSFDDDNIVWGNSAEVGDVVTLAGTRIGGTTAHRRRTHGGRR